MDDFSSEKMADEAKTMLSIYLKPGFLATDMKWSKSDEVIVGLIVDNIILASVAKMTELFMNSLDKKEKQV
jgi:hypothetical protein